MSFRGDAMNSSGRVYSDNTTGPGNRDAWNNPIRQEPQRHKPEGDGPTDGNNSDTTNNDGLNADVFDKIWDKVTKENKEDPNKQQPQQPQNQGPQPTREERIKSYLTEQGLDPIVLTDADKEAMSGGDFGPMVNKLNEKIVNAHLKALSGAETMIQARVTAALQEVDQKSNQNWENRMAIQKLNEQLPWSKDKAIAPVAQSVMQRFLDRGKTIDEAIKGVQAYYEETDRRRGINTSRSGNYNSDNRGPKVEPPEGGWLDLLGGRSQR